MAMLKPLSVRTRAVFRWSFVLLAGLSSAGALWADDIPGTKLIDPRSYGFRAPPAKVDVPADMRVLVQDGSEVVVARVHARVGEYLIVLLPDGRLEDRRESEVQVTDKPFEAAEMNALADRLRVGLLAGFKTKKSKYHLFVYNTSEDYVDATRRILDSMDRGLLAFTRKLGCEPSEPQVPLVVVLFRTEREFQAYKAMPPGVVAYYNVVTNQIVLHEEPPLMKTRPDLALGQAISTIAHEGTHQILHNIGIQQRLSVWPMWLNEGLAEYLAPTSFGTNFRWKGAGEINDLRMFELESYIQSRSFKGLDGQTIRSAVEAQQLDSTGYATAWAITHFLCEKNNTAFQEYVRLLSGMPPLAGMVAKPNEPVGENVEQFATYFGDDFPLMETDLVRHLEKQPYTSPVAAAPHFVALIQYPNGKKNVRRGGFFYRKEEADKWLRDFLSELDEPVRAAAQYQIEEFRNREEAQRWLTSWTR
jgi:hypothetical protein